MIHCIKIRGANHSKCPKRKYVSFSYPAAILVVYVLVVILSCVNMHGFEKSPTKLLKVQHKMFDLGVVCHPSSQLRHM